MAECKYCEYWCETLPGLRQCVNPKSVMYHEDTKPTYNCSKAKFTGYGEKGVAEDEYKLMRERIKEAMKDKYDMKQLAKACDITYQTIWVLLTKQKTPNLSTIIRIAEALNVSLDWLTGLRD